MLRVGVLVSGGGTNLQAIIDAKRAGRLQNVELSYVLSNNANAHALERARKAGIEAECLSPSECPDRESFNHALLRRLQEKRLGLLVLAGYLVQIPAELIRAFPGRIINIHPSLIPSFCGKGCYGLRVHEEALRRGVKITGATVHIVNEELDGGPILLQKAVAVRDGDTPEILQRRVMEEAEWILLPQAIEEIADGRLAVRTDEEELRTENAE